jgi:hypothetical protein
MTVMITTVRLDMGSGMGKGVLMVGWSCLYVDGMEELPA